MNKDTLFNEANKNFKLIHKSGRFKYRYLPNWVYRKSNYLLNEINSVSPNKKVYKQGSIVNVDFGVNVGSELSGNHFAIVLNKKDNSKNSKLTVVPLSSKNYKTSIKINDVISQKSNEALATYAKLSYDYIVATAIYSLDFFNNLGVDMSEYEKWSKVEESFKISSIKDLNDASLFLKKYLSTNDLVNLSPIEILEFGKKRNMQILECVESYKKYNKTSFAKIADITTISKNRLIKINELDPIGDIQVSKNTMKSINVAMSQQIFLDSLGIK